MVPQFICCTFLFKSAFSYLSPPSPPLLLLPPPPPAWVFLLCSRTPFQLFSISKMRHKSKLPCDTAATQPPLTDTERDWGEREASRKKRRPGEMRVKMEEWKERQESQKYGRGNRQEEGKESHLSENWQLNYCLCCKNIFNQTHYNVWLSCLIQMWKDLHCSYIKPLCVTLCVWMRHWSPSQNVDVWQAGDECQRQKKPHKIFFKLFPFELWQLSGSQSF